MTSGQSTGEQLERELAFYRAELNEIGARLLRLQEEQSRTAREARRSRTVARLIREAYRIADQPIPAELLGEPLLAVIADASVCDRAAFLREETEKPGQFTIEQAIGVSVGATVNLTPVPEFLYTASAQPTEPEANALATLMGVPYLLWAYKPASKRALLLGNSSESIVHRPFEATDRELVDGALAVYIDVLLKKRAEAALHQAKTAAEEASNARAAFLAALSHELTTPLNAIIGFSELLLSGHEQSEEQRIDFLRHILDSGRGLHAMVNDILDFSSFSNTGPRLRAGWTSVSSLLRASVRACNTNSHGKGVKLDLLPLSLDFEVYVDYDKFRQILQNLLDNAIKFTNSDGRVTVSCKMTGDGGMMLLVNDTGIGIGAGDIARVLEPFVQVDEHHRSKRGTGLGLPIAKQLTEAHGGQLLVESIFGEGTTVTVLLPRGTARRTAT